MRVACFAVRGYTLPQFIDHLTDDVLWRRLGLRAGSEPGLARRGRRLREEFQRDEAAEPCVFGL